MKRFLLAAALALTVHGLFFAFGPGMVGQRPLETPRPLTMTFSTRKAPAPEPAPTDPAPSPEAVAADAEKRPDETDAPKPPPDAADEEIVRPPEKRSSPEPTKPPAKPAPKVVAKTRQQDVRPPPRKEVPKVRKEKIAPPKKDMAFAPTSQPASDAPAEQKKRDSAGALSDLPGLTDKEVSKPGESAVSAPPVEEIIRAVPAYRDNPRPDYPRTAKRRGYEGTVMLEVLVNEAGKVEDLRIVASSGYDALDRSATRTVKQWLFEPGSIGGRKVEMWVRVPVRFELN